MTCKCCNPEEPVTRVSQTQSRPADEPRAAGACGCSDSCGCGDDDKPGTKVGSSSVAAA